MLHLYLSVAVFLSLVQLGYSRGATGGNFRSGQTRHYYIQAEEVEWDYAPTGLNVMTRVPLADDPFASVFTETTDSTIGRRYLKCQYFEYTDETFAVVRLPA